MSEQKRVRNEKLHAVLCELRRREKADHDRLPSDRVDWAIWGTCADMMQAVLNWSDEELDARPVTVALPRFRPGNGVWVAKQFRLTKNCPCCGGTSFIIGEDGNKYQCGNCNGGRVFDCDRYEPCQMAVSRVVMRLVSGGNCAVDTQYQLDGYSDPVEEYRLHATREECQATCDRMNAGEWGRAI